MKGTQLTADLNVLIIRTDKKIPLMRRTHTGYQDGRYGLPSGHLELNETPFAGAARELLEEIGVDIELSELHFKHFMLHESNCPHATLFFQVTWDGSVENKEPHKCDELRWVTAENLPELVAIDVILSTFHSPYPDDRMAFLNRLEVRSKLLGRKMTPLFTQFRATIPGSQSSNTLMRSFQTVSKVMGVPISTSEELRLREVFGYPGSDKLPNEMWQ